MIAIPSDIGKEDFVREVLLRDLNNIYQAQRLIISSNVYVRGRQLKTQKREGSLIGRRSGNLYESISSPRYTFIAEGSHFKLSPEYPIYIRFLDMKNKGNRQIYNRQIWGILYNNALRDLRSRYGTEIHDYVGAVLQDAFAAASTGPKSAKDFAKEYSRVRGR